MRDEPFSSRSKRLGQLSQKFSERDSSSSMEAGRAESRRER
jgi:hypothetical protein